MAKNSEFKIEKDVPVALSVMGRPSRYPFTDMEPGDSILVPAEHEKQAGWSAAKYAAYHGKTFASRKQSDGSRRIWRLE